MYNYIQQCPRFAQDQKMKKKRKAVTTNKTDKMIPITKGIPSTADSFLSQKTHNWNI